MPSICLSGGISALQKMLQWWKYKPRPSVSNVAVSVPTPLAAGTDTTAPDQLPDHLMFWQSDQAAPQARNYHWIATWQVLSSACTNLNI